MSEFENVDGILIRMVERLPKDLAEKLLQLEISSRWKEIVGNLAEQIKPIKLNGKILTIYADNPAVKDNTKFFANNIVEKINSTVGHGEIVVEKITFGRTFGKPDKNFEKIINPKPKNFSNTTETDLSKIILTEAEISECKEKLPVMKDEMLRQELLKTLLQRAKLQKWRTENGWHKCKICGELCEPNKIICDFCRIKEREEMQKKIRRIFYDLPWILFSAVQKQICNEMPHMAGECTLSVIESVWASLVVETAARVSFGDKNSFDAKFLVMLFKHIDKDKLTDKIINRTLNELRFNLANQPIVKGKN